MDDRQGRVPFEYALKNFSRRDPSEIEKRLHVPYDADKNEFEIHIMGEKYKVSWPDGIIRDQSGDVVDSYVIGILVLRFLGNGVHVPLEEKCITYKEIPDGQIYYPNFKKRTLDKLAEKFQENKDLFRFADPNKFRKTKTGDDGREFMIVDHVPMTFICWLGDDEFGPEANILFDQNISNYFNAEDLAVLPDLGIAYFSNGCKLPTSFGMYD
ncbi:DUF3786 domain-containing protein [Alkalibacter mobilis]|uniref:DUF3786 domain-containing protein n=1 Tax=Alkalibacter mobilis TaxID=2787712 RepID=UPI0018A0A779|nr:DUF3786 domain-containing protein [Alkalibacter mobilis]MBF7096396.1 DUF3786 domain-containing protein [Alkalibacter mobilis]